MDIDSRIEEIDRFFYFDKRQSHYKYMFYDESKQPNKSYMINIKEIKRIVIESMTFNGRTIYFLELYFKDGRILKECKTKYRNALPDMLKAFCDKSNLAFDCYDFLRFYDEEVKMYGLDAMNEHEWGVEND